ncbi:J domain-containing protein [Pandoraea eparura]|uniref:J domain-containing protein n=1 Tax=Pandoraea eparura TaxID=2508291 RepID=UPI0012421391|nr:J domain-containing protein [Pandoraea eparura]
MKKFRSRGVYTLNPVPNIHSHYENLKVARDAPIEVIRAAYKVLAQKWHPDRNDSPDAANTMQAINSAYGQLSDATKRRLYDDWLEAEELKWVFRHPTIVPQPHPTPPAPKRPSAPAPTAKAPTSGAFEIDESRLRGFKWPKSKNGKDSMGKSALRTIIWAAIINSIFSL